MKPYAEVTTKDTLIWGGVLIGLVLLGIWATVDWLSKVSL